MNRRLLAPIGVAFMGAVTAIYVMTATYGPIIDAVDSGHSPWLLLHLLWPLLPLAIGMAGGTWLDWWLHREPKFAAGGPVAPGRTYVIGEKPPAAKPQYRILDEEYDPVDEQFHTLPADLPKPQFGMAIYAPRPRLRQGQRELTAEQRADAAEDARAKRHFDGLGDPQ